MTTVTSTSLWWIVRRTAVKKDDVVIHIVLDTMNKTTDTLSQAAQRPDDCPLTAHIHELSQRLAEVTLDSLRSRCEE